MNTSSASMTAEPLNRLLTEQRAKLHRYCARMVGSVIDGEDVLQDVMLKAVDVFEAAGAIGNPEGWLFRTPTIRRWISCAGGRGSTGCTPARRST